MLHGTQNFIRGGQVGVHRTDAKQPVSGDARRCQLLAQLRIVLLIPVQVFLDVRDPVAGDAFGRDRVQFQELRNAVAPQQLVPVGGAFPARLFQFDHVEHQVAVRRRLGQLAVDCDALVGGHIVLVEHPGEGRDLPVGTQHSFQGLEGRF